MLDDLFRRTERRYRHDPVLAMGIGARECTTDLVATRLGLTRVVQ